MGLFAKIFTWWNGATIGTAFYTWRKGKKVGEDSLGNRYYVSDKNRRWVIYNGANDASRIPAEWHSWLHHGIEMVPDDAPPSVMPPHRVWERAPTGNLTGTDHAYRPSGALEAGGIRAAATGDYEAWTPEGEAWDPDGPKTA